MVDIDTSARYRHCGTLRHTVPNRLVRDSSVCLEKILRVKEVPAQSQETITRITDPSKRVPYQYHTCL